MSETLPLRDVIAFEPSWWPPAPLWWLIILAGLVLLFVGFKWLVSRVRGEYFFLKKAALRELDQLQTKQYLNDQQFSAGVSRLLKRVALQRFEGRNVVHLHGKKWLAFLDEAVCSEKFSSNGGSVLFDAQYRVDSTIDRDELVRAARDWLRAI